MRFWFSTWRLCALAAATLIVGCGSDYGGELGNDASVKTDSGRNEGGTDGSARADSDAAVDSGSSIDGGGGAGGGAADSGVPMDSGARDVSSTADAFADGGTGSDAAASDARDVSVPIPDARADVGVDRGGTDVTLPDVREAGSDGIVGPTCGNNVKDPGEECDDGNARDFDGCSSICTDRRACECCVKDNSPTGEGVTCDTVDGDAEEGPKTGTPRAQLCRETYTCILRSRCAFSGGAHAMECYCGAGNFPPGANTCAAEPRGPCVAEMEASLEVEAPTWQEKAKIVDERLMVQSYGGGQAFTRFTYDTVACPDDCVRIPPAWSTCANPDLSDAGDAAADVSRPDVSADASRPESGADLSTPETGADLSLADIADVNARDIIGPDGAIGIDQDCETCLAPFGTSVSAPCDALTGNAAGGPAMGVPKQQLCHETLNCVHQTNCHANGMQDCYCGTVIDQGECQTTTTNASGACKVELERSLEVPAGSVGLVALDRITNQTYAGGAAGYRAQFESADSRSGGCLDVCIPYTPTFR